jgi:hypothetical protein
MDTLSCHEWASPIFPGNIGSAVKLNIFHTASRLIAFDKFDILSDMETRRRVWLVGYRTGVLRLCRDICR